MSDYAVNDVVWPEYGLKFQIIKIPDADIEDKLALASPETGLVLHVEYQDFLFAKCIVDVDRVGRFIEETAYQNEELLFELRNQLEDMIVEVNPLFDPDNIVINGNGIMKLAAKSTGIALKENPDWDKKVDFLFISNHPEMDVYDTGHDDTFDNEATVSRIWERANMQIRIKKLSKEDLASFFEKPKFPNELLYKTYVMRKCLVSYQEVISIADDLGIADKIGAVKVIEELYEHCSEVNPFLKYEDMDINNLPSASAPRSGKITKPKSKPQKNKSSKGFDGVPKDVLLGLGQKLKEKIIGQDEAIDQIVELVQIAGSGLRNKEKPVANFLLCGPTGCGKTLTAKLLATALTGSKESIIRIDCSEYSQSHDVQKLIGAPPSYIGHDDGGYLTNFVKENPFCVVLFDELEKGHRRLYDMLLQILDDARLTDGKGNVANFDNCIVIMTSNIGIGEIKAVEKTIGFGNAASLDDNKRKVAVEKALKKNFKPEFLNRLDGVLNFKALTKPSIEKIINLGFQDLLSKLKDKNIECKIDSKLVEVIYKTGYSSEYNARPINRAVETIVMKPISKMLLSEELVDGNQITISWENEALKITKTKEVSR